MHQQYSKTRDPRAQDQCTWWKVDWGRDIMRAEWRPSVSTVCVRATLWRSTMLIAGAFLTILSVLSVHGQYLNVSFLNADSTPDDMTNTWCWSLLVLSFQLDSVINYGEYSTDAPVTNFDLSDWLFDLLDVSKCPLFLLCWSPSLLPARGLAFYLSLSRCLWSKPLLQRWLVPK